MKTSEAKRAYSSKWNREHKEQRNERLRAWCKNKPALRWGRYHRARLKKYGLSPQLYDCILRIGASLYDKLEQDS